MFKVILSALVAVGCSLAFADHHETKKKDATAKDPAMTAPADQPAGEPAAATTDAPAKPHAAKAKAKKDKKEHGAH